MVVVAKETLNLLRDEYSKVKAKIDFINDPKESQDLVLRAKEIGISAQQTRTALDKLKSTNEITIKTTNKYSVVSINNYSQYQSDNKQDNKQTTNKQQSKN